VVLLLLPPLLLPVTQGAMKPSTACAAFATALSFVELHQSASGMAARALAILAASSATTSGLARPPPSGVEEELEKEEEEEEEKAYVNMKVNIEEPSAAA